MRPTILPEIDAFRVVSGPYRSDRDGKPTGMFLLPMGNGSPLRLCVLADDGRSTGWEHVSVSLQVRRSKHWATAPGDMLPTWQNMHAVKEFWWSEEECVLQFHPPASQYVNHGPVLHLWRQVGINHPTPPQTLV